MESLMSLASVVDVVDSECRRVRASSSWRCLPAPHEHVVSQARRVAAGAPYDQGDNSLPFGGYKQSGIGRDKSLHPLDNDTQLKTTYINVLEG